MNADMSNDKRLRGVDHRRTTTTMKNEKTTLRQP